MTRSGIAKRLLRVATAVAVLAFGVAFFRNIDWSTLMKAVGSARWELIIAAALVNFAHLLIKAGRWGMLLSPVGRVGLFPLFRYTIAGYAASNILPARFGEILRVFYLRPHGIPAAGAAGVQVLEKVYEGVALLLLVLPLPWILQLPPVVSRTVAILAVVGLGAAAVVVWMARHHRIARQGWLARVGEGVAVLRQPRTAALALGLSLVIWVSDAIEVMLVMAAVGLPPSFFGAMLALLFINIFIAPPSTPAQLVAFEAGGVFALKMLGAPAEKALAFALLYHFMQAIPVTIAGMEALLVWRTLRAQAPASAGIDPAP
jgi:uncharacterized membrane protein YbhN (UPF0104 family)